MRSRRRLLAATKRTKKSDMPSCPSCVPQAFVVPSGGGCVYRNRDGAADGVRDRAALFRVFRELADAAAVHPFESFNDGLEIRGHHFETGVAAIAGDGRRHADAPRL